MSQSKPAGESSFRLIAQLTLVTLAIFCQATTAGAWQNDNAKILLHLTAPAGNNACDLEDAHPACSSVVTRGQLYPATYTAYLLLADVGPAAGITALECGIEYTGAPSAGVDVYSWNPCGVIATQFQLDGWPDAGGGLILIWDDCQSGVPGDPGMGNVVTCGFFYCAAYTPDQLRVVPHRQNNACGLPDVQAASVQDCHGEITDLESRSPDWDCEGYVDVHRTPYPLGFAAFSADGDAPGYNPCGAVIAVEATSWSRIKMTFGPAGSLPR